MPRGRVERLVATSGTAVCCADLIDHFADRPWKEVSGAREVRAKDLAALVDRLRPLKRRQIADLPPVGGPRSDSLLAGALLLQALVAHAGVERLQVSDRALREGLVLAALGQPIPAAAAPEDLRRRQVLQLAERSETVYRHNVQTARLSTRLFDVTASLHGLGTREREWLEYAALLHDIGYTIHYKGHHKHAYYLIANAVLDAFDQREIEIIAHVARYHRGATPKPSHPTMAAPEALAAAHHPQARRPDPRRRRPRPHPRLPRRRDLLRHPRPQGDPGGALPLLGGARAGGRPRARPVLREGLRLPPPAPPGPGDRGGLAPSLFYSPL